jgi:AraC-like DNA-binding protein
MIRYAYQLTDFRNWLRGFANLLNTPVTGGRIDIPPSLGDGYLLAANINPGISYVVMNFSLKDDLVFLRRRSVIPDEGLSLFFNHVTIADFFSIREMQNTITDKSPARSNIFLSSTRYELELTYSGNSRLKRVGIFFSPAFLHRCVKKKILRDLHSYADNRPGIINKEPIGFEYRQPLDDIFQADPLSPFNRLLLQNRTLLLTERFLHSFLTKTPPPQPAETPRTSKGKEKDIEALKSVEQILSDNHLNKFPSINHLSRTAMMSSTKLKTKFKQLYGMKLYEFYNRNRLGQAKELLKTGNYSVKQVGVTIGFSNLSNFAKAFKKEFGILPKEVLKNK